MFRCCLAIAACLAIPGPALAQAVPVRGDTIALDLETAHRIALTSRPELAAANARLDAARGDRRQAGAYPFNPEVQLKASSLIDPGGWSSLEAQLTQEIEWAGQWGLRKAAADASVTVARENASDAFRSSLYMVDAAFYRAVAASRQWDVRSAGSTMSRRLAEAVLTQLSEGTISQLEANLARIEAGRSIAGERSARRSYDTALLELRRTLGLAADTHIALVGGGTAGPNPDDLDLDSLVGVALAARPDLRAASARVDRWQQEARLASRAAVPNLRLSALAERSTTNDPLNWGLQLAVPIPLWNRNGGRREAALGEAAAAVAEQTAVQLQVQTDVAQSLTAYRLAREELDVFETEVVEPARANQALLDTAYAAGRLDLPTVLLLRTQLLDVEIGYWDTWLADRTAYAALQSAIGDAASRR